MSVSYVPLCGGKRNHSIFFYFQIIEGQWRKISITVVMAMGMKWKLNIAVYSLKINYSFYLLYLFFVSTFHHFVPSHCCVDAGK